MYDLRKHWLNSIIRLFLLFLLGFVSLLAVMEWLPVLFPKLKLFYELPPTSLSLLVLLGNAFFGFMILGSRFPIFSYSFGAIWIVSFAGLYSAHLTQFGVNPSSLGIGLTVVALLVAAMFRLSIHARIQSRVFLICVLSAAIPALFLSLALYVQTIAFFRDQIGPRGRSLLQEEAQWMDESVARMVGSWIMRFLASDQATGPFQILSREEYERRSVDQDFPLISLEEESRAFLQSFPAIDKQTTTIGPFFHELAERYGKKVDIHPPSLAGKPFVVSSVPTCLGEFVEAVSTQSVLKWYEFDGTWFLRENPLATASSSSGPVSVALTEATGRETGNLQDRFLGAQRKPENFGEALFHLNREDPEAWHILEILLPRRVGNQVTGIVHFSLNLGRLQQKAIAGLRHPRDWGVVVIFPYHRAKVSEALKTYRFSGDSRGNLADFLGNAEFPILNQISGGRWESGSPMEVAYTFQPGLSGGNLGGTGGIQLVAPDGRFFFFEVWNLPRSACRVLLGIPLTIICRAFFQLQFFTILIAFVAILWAGLLSLIYSESLSSPIQEITHAAREIRDGNLDTEIPLLTGQGEFQELGETLNVMAGKLKGRLQIVNRQLLAEKSKFETLVESTWEGIFLLDENGCLLHANPSGKQILVRCEGVSGFLPALEKIGTGFQPPLPQKTADFHQEFRTLFSVPQEGLVGGRIFSLYVKAAELPGTDSEPFILRNGFIAVCRDVTVEKEIERMKNDFVSQVSHELRTPLTSLQAYSEMLMDDEVGDETTRREYLSIIHQESERLTRLINELLDIARIESGRRPITPKANDLVQISRHVVDVLKGQAERKNLSITINLPSEPVLFLGDSDLLTQLGLNLLSNAVKYTRDGGTIGVALEIESEALFWRFSDSGIGLTPQELSRLFTKFFRADSDYVRGVTGTGLGLPLVKSIVEAHHGSIHVESEWGKGSLFSVRFPR
jgi:signal transduction histidine kinase/HAMP domain-containing protein